MWCACRYAWSEGGDSLLDSEKDSEGEEDECLEIHPPVSHVSTPSQECNTHTPQVSLLAASHVL